MVLLRSKESYPFYFGASADLLNKAGVLRRNMTPAEKVLWEYLRNRKMDGLRFRRQHPIDIGLPYSSEAAPATGFFLWAGVRILFGNKFN